MSNHLAAAYPVNAGTRARHQPEPVVDSAMRGCCEVAHKDGTAKARRAERALSKSGRPERLPKKLYETELYRLQAELGKAQEWGGTERAGGAGIFEGRGAADEGS